MVVKEEQENDEECFKKALNLCTSLQNYKGKLITFQLQKNKFTLQKKEAILTN